MKFKSLLPIAAAAIAFVSTAATAATVNITFSGTLAETAPGADTYDLDGADFVATYTIDTTKTAYNAPTYGALAFSQFNGFSVDFSVTNRKNGAADIVVENHTAEGNIRNYENSNDQLTIFNNGGGNGEFSSFSIGFRANGDSSLFPQSGNVLNMSFLENDAFALDSFDEVYFYAYAGWFGTSSVEVQGLQVAYGAAPASAGPDVSAVPLPASALLLIGALGGLVGMRRRRQTA